MKIQYNRLLSMKFKCWLLKFQCDVCCRIQNNLAVGIFDQLSIATLLYACLSDSPGRDPAKSNCTSSLGSTIGSI